MGCKACGSAYNIGSDGRCRLCRAALTATDMGTSYGKLQARIWAQYGDQVQREADPMLRCPVCKRLFLPRTANQIYDSNACAVKAAQAAYRKRKRTKASRAPVGKRKEPKCSSSEGSTEGRSTRKQSTRAGRGMTVTPKGKGRTG